MHELCYTTAVKVASEVKKDELIKSQQSTQRRLVVWVVLTIVFQILRTLLGWQILQYVAWIAAAYCVILIALWCYFEWQLLK